MEDLKKQRDEIVKSLKIINGKVTEEMLQKASKEELEEYLELIDAIVLKLTKIELELKNNEK